ncbi:MAG: restriction endonuclease subunit S [Thermoguttaceae bacterium]
MKTSTNLNGSVRKWKRYQDRKSIDLDWCREVPSHWSVAALKRFARFQSGDGITSLEIEPEGEFPVYGGNGLRGYTSKYTHDGTFVLLGRQGALCGNVNYASGKFWASEHAVVVTPSKEICQRWYGELLRAMNLGRYSMSAAQPGLSVQFVVNLQAPIPPLDEQRRIVAFLDREMAKIDALIAKKERLIGLLQEKRTALISHAVTKGLAPSLPMKDSRVEWVQEIPAHWRVLRNGFLFSDRDERGYPDLPILEVSIHTGVKVREFSGEHVEQQAEDPATYKRSLTGDLAFNKMRMWQGAVGVTPVDGLVSPDYQVCRPRPGVHSRYFEQLFRTGFYMTEINRYSHGIVKDRNRLYWDQFKEMPSLVPPAEEQVQIIAHIDAITDRTERLIAKVREAIEKLREYRTALISAAVTGKIDVQQEVD